MAEVRRFFCCTDNLTACKIAGGVQIALNAILIIFMIICLYPLGLIMVLTQGHGSSGALALLCIFAVLFGSGILSAILLVVAASKRSATMLMVWIVLNGIGIGLGVISLFRPIFTGLDYSLIGSLISIGLGIWAELIAIGARLEVKSGAWTWIPMRWENQRNFVAFLNAYKFAWITFWNKNSEWWLSLYYVWFITKSWYFLVSDSNASSVANSN